MEVEVDKIQKLLVKIGRGKKGSRPFTLDEAKWIFGLALTGALEPVQMGVLLAASRMKEETEDELVGFIEAVHENMPGFGKDSAPKGAVEIPSYAGRRRSAPLNLVAALEAKERGVPMVIHGLAHYEGRLSAWDALREAKVRAGKTISEAMAILKGDGVVWIDVKDVSPGLFDVLDLRHKIGIRTFAHAVARLINPLKCDGQLNGISHSPFLKRMCQVNARMGHKRSFIFLGMEGEPELHMNAEEEMALQDGNDFYRLACTDMDNALKPGTDITQGKAMERFKAILAGDHGETEQIVLDRMKEVIDIASTGVLPQNWSKETMNE